MTAAVLPQHEAYVINWHLDRPNDPVHTAGCKTCGWHRPNVSYEDAIALAAVHKFIPSLGESHS